MRLLREKMCSLNFSRQCKLVGGIFLFFFLLWWALQHSTVTSVYPYFYKHSSRCSLSIFLLFYLCISNCSWATTKEPELAAH